MWEIITAIATTAISIISAFIAALVYHHNADSKKRELDQSYARYKIERNLLLVTKLDKWEKSFELFGIDMDAALAEGVTKEHILFLAVCLDGQSASATALNITVKKYIEDSRWRKHMYDQEITRKAWKYVRLMYEDFTLEAMDDYMEKHSRSPQRDSRTSEG